MECEPAIRGLLGDAADAGDGVCVSCWDRQRLNALDAQSKRQMADVINVFGRRSCKAQGLGAAITDWTRMASGHHRLYIAARAGCRGAGPRGSQAVLGFLKTGRKHLFLRVSDMSATLREVEPVCVLDFYVHESLQRQGVGLKLMHAFFRSEGVAPEAVAYDRPSGKLICFLRRHFGLQDYVNQSNNYVVFRRFWDADRQQQQQHRHRGHEDAAATGRRDAQRAQGGAWSTINQRPLSGTRQQRLRRNRRQQQQGDHQAQQQQQQSTSYSPGAQQQHQQQRRGPLLPPPPRPLGVGVGEGAGPAAHAGGGPQYGRRAHGARARKEDLLDVTASVHNHAGAVYGTGARYFVHGHHQQHGRQLHDDENEMARRSARLPMYGRRADAMDATDGCKMAQPQPIASLAAAAGSRSIAAYKSSWPY